MAPHGIYQRPPKKHPDIEVKCHYPTCPIIFISEYNSSTKQYKKFHSKDCAGKFNSQYLGRLV